MTVNVMLILLVVTFLRGGSATIPGISGLTGLTGLLNSLNWLQLPFSLFQFSGNLRKPNGKKIKGLSELSKGYAEQVANSNRNLLFLPSHAFPKVLQKSRNNLMIGEAGNGNQEDSYAEFLNIQNFPNRKDKRTPQYLEISRIPNIQEHLEFGLKPPPFTHQKSPSTFTYHEPPPLTSQKPFRPSPQIFPETSMENQENSLGLFYKIPELTKIPKFDEEKFESSGNLAKFKENSTTFPEFQKYNCKNLRYQKQNHTKSRHQERSSEIFGNQDENNKKSRHQENHKKSRNQRKKNEILRNTDKKPNNFWFPSSPNKQEENFQYKSILENAMENKPSIFLEDEDVMAYQVGTGELIPIPIMTKLPNYFVN